jgi:hypothetical protein
LAVGLNRTVTVHVPETGTDVPQVVDTKEKSVPATDDAVGTVTARAPMPVFDRVATAVLEAPTAVAGKAGVDRAADWP